jgi:signal transduction histidine kinase
MQTTVDTFVSRYAETVQRQTGQLEGFNRMLTHEIRQPLGTIRSAVELLRRSDTPSDRRDRCAELIETNCVRMAALTTRLLTLSSLDVDSLHTQEADLKKLAEDAVDQLKDMAAQKAVTVRCDVPSILLFTAVARLELILVNLLSNAIKYSDPKKTVRFVELSAEQQSESVLLCVRDNGIGIPPDTRGRIFDGFYRAHASRDGELQTDGVGLGLAIVMECARHLGATVSVESEDGTGTTFTVQVPLHATIEPLPMRAEG